jgi:membrane-associated protein
MVDFTQLIVKLIDFILHVDKYLNVIIANYGYLTYPILFFIIFLETGLVITPFLPGDSLIFIAGAISARGSINIILLWVVLCFAAVLGDSVNYFVGSYFGEKLFLNNRFFKKHHLDKTKGFYEKHGGKTIVLARFVPIVRTFAPFVAGIGKMNYKKFLGYNLFGGILWVTLFVFAGYFFGTIPLIQNNLTIVIIIIVLLSIVPVILEYLKIRKNKQ